MHAALVQGVVFPQEFVGEFGASLVDVEWVVECDVGGPDEGLQGLSAGRTLSYLADELSDGEPALCGVLLQLDDNVVWKLHDRGHI